MLNETNTKHIAALEEEVRYQRELNRQLLARIGVGNQVRTEINIGEMNPIGGYIPLRRKIAEREQKSMEEFNKLLGNNRDLEEEES